MFQIKFHWVFHLWWPVLSIFAWNFQSYPCHHSNMQVAPLRISLLCFRTATCPSKAEGPWVLPTCPPLSAVLSSLLWMMISSERNYLFLPSSGLVLGLPQVLPRPTRLPQHTRLALLLSPHIGAISQCSPLWQTLLLSKYSENGWAKLQSVLSLLLPEESLLYILSEEPMFLCPSLWSNRVFQNINDRILSDSVVFAFLWTSVGIFRQ